MEMPTINRKYQTFAEYGAATLEQAFGRKALDAADRHYANTFASMYVENLGGGHFRMHQLPLEAQFAPIYGTVVEDFDGDGNLDLLLAGNFHGPDAEIVRYDGGQGLLMSGDGAGGFSPVSMQRSGFRAAGDVRGLSLIQTGRRTSQIVVLNNDGQAETFGFATDAHSLALQRLDPKQRCTRVTIRMNDGSTRRREIELGSGYWSQRSLMFFLPKAAKGYTIYDGNDKVVSVDVKK
jgi:hypothetical protein